MENELNKIFIEVTYNDRELDYIDEFIQDLRQEYQIVQQRPKWLAAASDGGETWIDIILNFEAFKYLQNLAIDGILWDGIKIVGIKYCLTPLKLALEKLSQRNENAFGLRVIRLKLQFDDITIILGGLNQNFTSIISSTFQILSTKTTHFEENLGIINQIELPITFNESIDAKGYSPYLLETRPEEFSIEYYSNLWKIIYNNGGGCTIYEFKSNSFKDCYPN